MTNFVNGQCLFFSKISVLERVTEVRAHMGVSGCLDLVRSWGESEMELEGHGPWASGRK